MKNQSFTNLLLLLLFAWTSCQETPKPAQPLALGTVTFKKSEGRDCASIDSLHTHCATINLAWTEVKDGDEVLKTNVATWSQSFLAGLMANAIYDSTGATSVEAAAQNFFAAHSEWSKEAQESPLGMWTVESEDSVLLDDGKHLTLQISAYLFTGGAHGTPVSSIGSFDVASGKQLAWADWVTDTVALKSLAEKKFRAVRVDIFQPSEDGMPAFNFDENWPFALPQNYGLTDKGIYCHYDHYEVTPYSLGSTDFVLTFDELGTLLK